MIVPTGALPVIWLRKDPQTIISGTHDFFFPFLKQENLAIVREYPIWGQEVLNYFADKIKKYPTSDYTKDKDSNIVAQAEKMLHKEYEDLVKMLGTRSDRTMQCRIEKDSNGPSSNKLICVRKPSTLPVPCTTPFSPEQRKKLRTLLGQTSQQLFGKPIEKIVGMVGIQGPKLVDFKRRAAIEDTYASLTQEIDRYKNCSGLTDKDRMLIEKSYARITKAYNEVLDAEGLRTAKIMENV